jgi:hypothetical protein
VGNRLLAGRAIGRRASLGQPRIPLRSHSLNLAIDDWAGCSDALGRLPGRPSNGRRNRELMDACGIPGLAAAQAV